jgi:hypothetical protein
VYYVSGRGSDGNPGSQRWPLRTIGAAAARAQASDLVVVRPGTYRESVVLTRSGEPGAPIVFRCLPGAVLASPDPSGSLSAFDISNDVSFVTVQGFELTGGFAETVFVRQGAHDIELAGLHIHHNRTGIWIAGAANVLVRDSVIDHNFRTGIRLFAGAQRVRVVDTRSEANDDGAGCDGDSDGFNADASTSDIWFERATATGNSEDGFDLQGPNVTVLQCVAQDNRCSGVKRAAGGYLENVLVERSRIGININAPAGATTALHHCTLSQNDLGLRTTGRGHAVALRNSIIAGPAKALWFPSTVQLSEDHNLLYRPSPRERLIVRADNTGETQYSADDINQGAWRRGSGQGDATFARDPQLQDGSCQPRSNSAAIDSGGAAGFAPVDLAGTLRPLGNAVDRGAFEWMPTAPTLRVRRGRLHAGSTGRGSVQVRAEWSVPAQAGVAPLTHPVAVALRGARGDVVRAEIAPDEWKRSQRNGTTLLRLARADGFGRSVRLAMRVTADRVELRLTARAADVWAADARGVALSVELGGVRAVGEATLRQAGRTLFVP